jgi:hypothetical protein
LAFCRVKILLRDDGDFATVRRLDLIGARYVRAASTAERHGRPCNREV